jgi:hypothetical protein
MNRPAQPAPFLGRLASPAQQDGLASIELARLRKEYPRHWIGTETIVGRGARYVARACQHDARPHTVLTSDLSELRTALEAGRAISQERLRP